MSDQPTKTTPKSRKTMEIKKFGFYFLFIIIAVMAIKFYGLIETFLPSIATGCVFAYLFNPLYKRCYRLTKHRTVAGLTVIVIITFLVLIPVTLIIIGLQQQIEFLFSDDKISRAREGLNGLDEFLRSHLPIDFADSIINRSLNEIIPRIITTLQNAITYLGPKMLFSMTRFVLSAFITIFIMYYILIQSEKVIKVFRDYFPISYKNSEILLDEMGRQTKALIYGQLLISIIQGSLGALGFMLFGVSGALFWGLIMVITSFLPVFGASIVWLPAVIIMISQSRYFAAVGLFLWGALIVGTIDNLLRPKLTETLGKIHPVTVLLGVFIGIKEWGFIGVVIGPLLITVLIVLIKMFREEYLVE